MMQVCFMRWAIFGISSEMWMPGTRRRDRPERPAGGRARLGVPGLELARAAGQPEQDDALLLPLQLAGEDRALEDVEHRHVRGERRGAGGGRPRGTRDGSARGRVNRKTIGVARRTFVGSLVPCSGDAQARNFD